MTRQTETAILEDGVSDRDSSPEGWRSSYPLSETSAASGDPSPTFLHKNLT